MNKLLLLLYCALALPAWGQPAADDSAERSRIAAERSRLDAEFEASRRACYGKFAVNDCIDAARRSRREALADLRRQEVALNDAQRKQRAAERLSELEARQSKAEQQRSESRTKPQAHPQVREERSGPKAAKPERAPSAAKAPNPKAPREQKTRDEPDTEENLRRHQRRLAEAEEHKAKAAERAAQARKDVRPLPVPP